MVETMLVPESPISTELNSAATLLNQGAACNVIFINSVDMESLTGPQAVAKAIKITFDNLTQGKTTVVHFKVSNQGITLTDNNRKWVLSSLIVFTWESLQIHFFINT